MGANIKREAIVLGGIFLYAWPCGLFMFGCFIFKNLLVVANRSLLSSFLLSLRRLVVGKEKGPAGVVGSSPGVVSVGHS